MSKILVIQEGCDINNLIYDELRGNLIAYEITHLKNEGSTKKKKELTLKAKKREKEEEESEPEIQIIEEFALIVQRLNRMLKRRGKLMKRSNSKKDGGKEPFNKKDVIYHKCK